MKALKKLFYNEVDCLAGLEAGCKAKCCSLKVLLTDEEIENGIAQPMKDVIGGKIVNYIVARGEDGYCIYLDKETLRRNIYEKRPAICREYSCANDSKIDEKVRRALKMKHLLMKNS